MRIGFLRPPAMGWTLQPDHRRRRAGRDRAGHLTGASIPEIGRALRGPEVPVLADLFRQRRGTWVGKVGETRSSWAADCLGEIALPGRDR